VPTKTVDDRGAAPTPFRALVAGAGVAGLEGVLALHDLAGDAVEITLLAPEAEFRYRPLSVREPFAYAGARSYPVAAVAEQAGATVRADALAWVAPAERVVHTAAGDALVYDALLLAMGARPAPGFRHATTIDDRRIDEIYRGIVQDVEQGYVRRIAFVMSGDLCWPLPLYELALMTAQRAYAMCVDVELTVVIPGRAPLEAFGQEASGAVATLLAERGIAVEAAARVNVRSRHELVIAPGDRRLEVDRIVALPDLRGPGVRGLHTEGDSFVPIDDRCRVRGVERVFAAGDAADFPIKHGGVSAQMADTAARGIARLAGVELDDEPLRPHVEGMLLTGGDPLYLSATVVAGTGLRSRVSDAPLWTPPQKIAARHLGPVLERLDRAARAA
jgi:sulfide:quinone oxidoreductase